jgi:hypothetical protein
MDDDDDDGRATIIVMNSDLVTVVRDSAKCINE